MNYHTIEYKEIFTGIGQVTLNRPERLNAINHDMLDELYAFFNEIKHRDDIRVLIMTGAGRGFCSGADIKIDPSQNEERMKMFSNTALHLENVQRKYSRIIIEMRRISQPIIAAVNGVAAGGGFSMALASDIIIGNTKAAFIASFINIGLSGGELGSTYFLPKAVGSARASEILMTGRTVLAEEAERIGLISRLVPDKELMDTTLEIAKTLTGKSKMGLKFTKEAMRQNLNAPSIEAAIELEDRNQSICCCSPAFIEAVSAFGQLEKNG
jgi:enoyl-CoA hydratase